LSPVLAAAADADAAARRDTVRAALRSARFDPGRAALPAAVDSREARRYNEAARQAYWARNSVADAVRLQTQAFGANPLDPEVVGNLAFLRLRSRRRRSKPHASSRCMR
jgi:hypothetical protein